MSRARSRAGSRHGDETRVVAMGMVVVVEGGDWEIQSQSGEPLASGRGRRALLQALAWHSGHIEARCLAALAAAEETR